MTEEELKRRFAVYTWIWRMNRKYIDLETKNLTEEESEKLWHDLVQEADEFMLDNGIKSDTHDSYLVVDFLFNMEKFEREKRR